MDRVRRPDRADAEGRGASTGVAEQVVEEGLVAFFRGGDAVREDEGQVARERVGVGFGCVLVYG